MIRWPDAPVTVLVATALAMVLELIFYFTQPRRPGPVALLVGSAALPYLLYSVPAGVFDWRVALVIPAAAALVLCWFRLWPRSPWTDAAFLLVMAAPLIFKVPGMLYVRPAPELRLEVLGQLMWIRMGISAVLRYRPQTGINFAFWPGADAWRNGALFFLLFLPVFAIAVSLGITSLREAGRPWWVILLSALGTFFGILWVVALSEEFFFRGLLQQWLDAWTKNPAIALLLTSVLFGAAHLGFRQFPNWEFALFAGTAGLLYGLAFRRGKGIPAAMVTHALVVTMWRTLFR